ncbi:MAG: tRNA (adenosine(37)-N6)-threonylcarbamoyltransferase complex ATPase subunit type 1 TsaE [Balneolaceae bacterium]|nr:tRNA (adenosine(37)-N6)-threonylcarbamoyltransferase complex ATPase subunit type 1 TsaE [Balneolaceae bacterium]
MNEIITESEEQTRKLGENFAANLKPGDVVCLVGELGTGKTQFVKGLARHFGIDPGEVLSPTFTLIHEYRGRLPVYHFDCYRMESPREALEIGAEEYFYGEGVSVIEWAGLIESLIPDDAFWIRIEALDTAKRKFLFDKKKK